MFHRSWLHPRQNWPDKRSYDRTAAALTTRFRENADAVGIPRTFWGCPVFGLVVSDLIPLMEGKVEEELVSVGVVEAARRFPFT